MRVLVGMVGDVDSGIVSSMCTNECVCCVVVVSVWMEKNLASDVKVEEKKDGGKKDVDAFEECLSNKSDFLFFAVRKYGGY